MFLLLCVCNWFKCLVYLQVENMTREREDLREKLVASQLQTTALQDQITEARIRCNVSSEGKTESNSDRDKLAPSACSS